MYPIPQEVRDILVKKPAHFEQNSNLVRLRLQLQEINHYIQQHLPLEHQQAHWCYAALTGLEGKFNLHVDAFVLAPCVMQVEKKVVAAALNQGLGANIFCTAEGAELHQAWDKKSPPL